MQLTGMESKGTCIRRQFHIVHHCSGTASHTLPCAGRFANAETPERTFAALPSRSHD